MTLRQSVLVCVALLLLGVVPLHLLRALEAPTLTVNGTTLLQTDEPGRTPIVGGSGWSAVLTFAEDLSVPPTVRDDLNVTDSTLGDPHPVNDCADADTKTYCFTYTPPSGINSAFRYFEISDAQNAAAELVATTTYRFIVDTQGASIAITSPATSNFYRPTIGGTSDSGEFVGVTLSGPSFGPWYATSSISGGTWSVTVPVGLELAEGTYTITASSTDTYGNPSNEATQTLEVTNSAPLIAITSGLTDGAYSSSTLITFGFTVTDADSTTVTCSFERETPYACTSPASATLVEGIPRTFDLLATDLFGNAAAKRVTFAIDLAPPVFSDVPSIIVQGTDTTTPVTYDLPVALDALAGTTTVMCVPASGSGFAVGSTTVLCTTNDLAGNTASTTFAITVTPPPAPPAPIAVAPVVGNGPPVENPAPPVATPSPQAPSGEVLGAEATQPANPPPATPPIQKPQPQPRSTTPLAQSGPTPTPTEDPATTTSPVITTVQSPWDTPYRVPRYVTAAAHDAEVEPLWPLLILLAVGAFALLLWLSLRLQLSPRRN